ncbi:medium-chain acyl-CoA ligase ACSF2, mitochondrial-like [Diadema setosum]|uniref:medium-chain acyl-CoA ligase ACSF2, mitochondrial-like n=1 Tax=Diadema setosum TaxID=31175 RepID=UPI003B3BD84C
MGSPMRSSSSAASASQTGQTANSRSLHTSCFPEAKNVIPKRHFSTRTSPFALGPKRPRPSSTWDARTSPQHSISRGISSSPSSSSSSSGSAPLPTISYFQGSPIPPLIGKTLGQCLDEVAEEKGDEEAFVFLEEGVRLTYCQFREKVDNFAAGLLSIGVKKGDRVGVWGSNTSEWIITQFAAARIGAILVTINMAYTAPELQYALHKAGVKAIVSSQEFAKRSYYEILSTVCPELPNSDPGRLKSAKLPMMESIIMMGEGDFPGTFRFDDVITMGTSEQQVSVERMAKTVQFDDPIAILFTSGTTGNPKGALMTHHRLVNQGIHIGARLNYHEGGHKACLPVPLYHIFGLAAGPIVSLMYAVPNVYPTASYNPSAALRAIQDEKCTVLYGTPTMFVDVINQPSFKDTDLSSLSFGVVGGSPCPSELAQQVVKGMGMNYLAIGFGLTEAGPMVSIVDREMPEDKRVTTVGKLCQHTEAKIIDPQTGNMVPVNTAGELCIRGYQLMVTYWENEEATRECMDKTRWFHTGDLATFDEEGHCSIVGRIKDLIIRGGRNIQPAEVEEFIHTHPSVADVQVIGIPDARLGEEVVACVRVKPGQELTQQEVIDFCKDQISHYKVPRHVFFMETFPMTVTGKVQKFRLQEIVCKDLKKD